MTMARCEHILHPIRASHPAARGVDLRRFVWARRLPEPATSGCIRRERKAGAAGGPAFWDRRREAATAFRADAALGLAAACNRGERL